MLRNKIDREWQPVVLALICGLAAVLYGWAIWSSGYGDPFYAAAARSMSENWHNFLFGSFDPIGVVTVDKPPMALWFQVVSVKIFGFHGWSVLLPQVIEGVATVFLLHRTVRRWAGENVALIAALALATTPITVAIARDNLLDTLMVLWLVAAAYALTRAIEADSSYWLLLSAFFVGCGFMTKMLEAWIVVPALALAFLFGSTTPMARRLVQLAGSGVVLVMSSFWWIALVDLWPGPKPYIGSSPNGTAFSLAIGYNGIERILPGRTVDNTDSVAGLLMGGMPGLLRFFNPQVGGQISWLLPLVLLTLIVGVVATVRHRGFERWLSPMQRAGWILWAGWLLTGWVLLSFAFGAFHPYLTAVLAPAVAAAAAAGLDRLWRSYREPTGWGWVLLPIGIVITTLWAVALVARDPAWNGWLGYVCLGLGVVTLGVLLALRASRVPRQSLNILVNLLILTTILLGPTTWSVATGFGPSHAFLGPHNPSAGPFVRPTVRDVPEKQRGILGPLQPPGPFDLLIGRLTPEQVHLLDYSEAHAGNARIALAVEEGALFSSPYQIATHHDDVIGMGGYMGSDPAPTIDQLATWKTQGELRFVLSNAPSSGKNVSDLDKLGGPVVAQRVRWVRTHCRIVPRSVYRDESAPSGVFDTLTLEALYDCG